MRLMLTALEERAVVTQMQDLKFHLKPSHAESKLSQASLESTPCTVDDDVLISMKLY